MNENQNIILQKQSRRYGLLIKLWSAAEGKENIKVNFMHIAKNAGYDEEEAKEIYDYFNGEEFFKFRTVIDFKVTLSHKAILEIEKSMTNSKQSTEHFPSTVIQHFNATVSAVQNGNNNVANINQTIGQNFSEILEQLAILKNQFQSLPIEEREEAIEVMDAIAVEVQSENPSKGKIKSFLLATKDFAVKTGTDVVASTLSKLIESQMGIKG